MQTFAGVIALLNDFRLSQGKASLGFLNPLIYSTGVPGFNDITSGSNPGCGTNGFTAGAGWDPVSVAAGLERPPYHLHSLTSLSRSGHRPRHTRLRQAAGSHWVSGGRRESYCYNTLYIKDAARGECAIGNRAGNRTLNASDAGMLRARVSVVRAASCAPWHGSLCASSRRTRGRGALALDAARGRSASAFIRSDESDKVVAAERAPPRRIEQISKEPAAARGVWKDAAACFVVRGRVQEGFAGAAYARAHAGRREEE